MILKNTYDYLEDAVKARLQPLLSQGFEIEVVQGKPGQLVKAFSRSRCTVSARGSTFEEPFQGSPRPQIRTISGSVTQTETVKVDLVLESKNIRGFDGIYSMRAQVEKLLLGYSPKPWTPLYLLAFGFDSHVDGVWVYNITMCTTVSRVGEIDEVAEVLITEITTIENITTNA